MKVVVQERQMKDRISENAAGGALGGKTVREIQEIFESLATNSLQKGVKGNPRGVHGINANSDVTRQLASLQM
ncbi:hypothetical protein LIER_26033 [Lithospermum erythrorhizon]|uniref:Uncharacterized protein n=1 Tax=Lithospermum erythrorhizon TaxID=34254 RepID=A0AAV3R911_LITER